MLNFAMNMSIQKLISICTGYVVFKWVFCVHMNVLIILSFMCVCVWFCQLINFGLSSLETVDVVVFCVCVHDTRARIFVRSILLCLCECIFIIYHNYIFRRRIYILLQFVNIMWGHAKTKINSIF